VIPVATTTAIDVVELTRSERPHDLIQPGADARDTSDLEYPRADPQRRCQISDRPRRDASNVGLHHDGVERLVDTAAGLQDRREEAALAQLGDLQVDIACLRGQQPIPAAVALVRARRRPLEPAGADVLGRLRVDQRLQHELDALADHVQVPAGADRVEQAGHVKLGQGHRETPSALFGRKAEDLPVAHLSGGCSRLLHHSLGRQLRAWSWRRMIAHRTAMLVRVEEAQTPDNGWGASAEAARSISAGKREEIVGRPCRAEASGPEPSSAES
jgi:hypothetical protein